MSSSVAVVVLDAMRSDYFDQEFNWLPGQHYDQVYSTSHWTIPAHASLFTGLIPRETGTYAGSPSFFPPEPPIQKQLLNAGYKCRIYTENIQLIQWDGWTEGFDEIVGPEGGDHKKIFDWIDAANNSILPEPLNYPETIVRCLQSRYPTIQSIRRGYKIKFGGRDSITIQDMYNMIQNADLNDEEFAFFNLMDVHSSSGRSTGQAIAEGVPNANKLKLHKSYITSVKELSEDYRQLFNHLYDKFDWVMTLSDHGELLGEHNLSGHGYGIYPELVQVPLVISSQNNTCSYSTEDIVSLLDIPSTIRDICDINDYGRGNSLLQDRVRKKAPVERLGQPHLHEDMFKRYNIFDIFEKYNTPLRGMGINKEGYAYETMSGLKSTEGWRTDGEVVISEFFDNIDIFSSMKGDLDISSDVQERLKDLGYA